jgi:hypothetical protein
MEENMREFQGKGAFITGGASGVGFALAVSPHHRGQCAPKYGIIGIERQHLVGIVFAKGLSPFRRYRQYVLFGTG